MEIFIERKENLLMFCINVYSVYVAIHLDEPVFYIKFVPSNTTVCMQIHFKASYFTRNKYIKCSQ